VSPTGGGASQAAKTNESSSEARMIGASQEKEAANLAM
jgi:hypothetical protein